MAFVGLQVSPHDETALYRVMFPFASRLIRRTIPDGKIDTLRGGHKQRESTQALFLIITSNYYLMTESHKSCSANRRAVENFDSSASLMMSVLDMKL